MVTQSASEHKKKVVKKRPFKNQGTCDGAFTIELIQENIKEYISNHKINMEKIDLYSILGVMEVDGLCLY